MALVVILPGPEDFGAGQVVSALRRRGADAAVVPGAILEVSRWEHRVVGGRAETVITLPTGLQLSSASVGAVLNRLPGASVRRFARSSERDLTYAAVESDALLLAWLSGLEGRAVGTPSPVVTGEGAGADGIPLKWLVWGRRCGLGGPRSVAVPRGLVAAGTGGDAAVERWTVVGHNVIRSGEVVEGEAADRVRALAALAGMDLLEVLLRSGAGRRELVGVSLRPALTGVVADVVADLLVERARGEELAS
jgi:hypothetical protein